VLFSRFAPAYLPFIAVKDREIELKRRIEAEEADKRMGSAVLSLARKFTATIHDAPQFRFHVNVDSPVIQALLGAPRERAAFALRLLAPLGVLLGEAGTSTDTEESLRGFSEAVCAVLAEAK
jgi:molecular chaperone HtpG